MQKDILPIVDLSLYTDSSEQAEKMFLKDRRHTAFLKAISQAHLRPQILSLRDAAEAPPQAHDPLVIFGCRTDQIEFLGRNFTDRRVIVRDGHVGMNVDFNLSVVGMDTKGEIQKILQFLSMENRRKVALFGFSTNVYRSCAYVRDFMQLAMGYGITVSVEDVFWNCRNITGCFESFAKMHTKYNAVVTADAVGAAYICIQMPKLGASIPDSLLVVGRGNHHLMQEISPKPILMKFDGDEMDSLLVSVFKYLRRHPEMSSICALVKSHMIWDDEIYNIVMPEQTRQDIPAVLQKASPADISPYRIHDIGNFFMRCDETDRSIVRCMQSGYPLHEIADKVYLSQRAISYRIKKILEITRTGTKEELIELLADFEI